ncbi:MAG: YadA C-terminal domain-containing protein [Pseudomonadota bacterium]|nr:YadA C-terminal domain-containing protein [Pseudomonadota bacterium]
MAALPDPADGKQFSVGAGAGTYEGEQGYAIGIKARFENNVSLTGALATSSSGGSASASIGAGYSW